MKLYKIKKLHNENKGNAMIIVVFFLFVLLCFFALTMNVGFQIIAKEKMQNAADSAALSGGLWIARGLNLVSILNVSMTESLASIIFLKAIHKANEHGKTICASNIVAAIASYNYKWLKRLLSVGIPGIREVENLYEDKIRSVMGHPEDEDPGTLWGIIRWLKNGEDAINASINDIPLLALMAEEEAKNIANINQAVSCQWLPKNFGMPVKQGKFHDLCHPTKYGGSGYKNFLGFDSALDLEINGIRVKDLLTLLWTVYPKPGEGADTAPLSPLIAIEYPRAVRLAYNTMCGSGETHEYEDMTMECSKCERDAKWVGTRVKIKPCEFYGSEISNRQYLGEKIGNIYPIDYDKKIENDGKCKVYKFTNKEPVYDDEDETYTCYKEEWTLLKCNYTAVEYVESDNNKPVPLVLDDEWRKKVNFVALVNKNTKDPFHFLRKEHDKQYSFGDPAINQTYGIAQIQIYNPQDENLFNQDWHIKLVPFNPDPEVINMYANIKDQNLIDNLKSFEELAPLITH